MAHSRCQWNVVLWVTEKRKGPSLLVQWKERGPVGTTTYSLDQKRDPHKPLRPTEKENNPVSTLLSKSIARAI